MNYICIVGQKGVGKDTFANMLADSLRERGVVCETAAFAEAVKDVLIYMFDCDSDIFYDPKEKEKPQNVLYGRTPRHVMQAFGTDFSQNMFSPSIWCDILFKRVESGPTAWMTDVTIVTDVRFEHELHALREKRATVIFIDKHETCFSVELTGWRKHVPKWLKRIVGSETDTHVSEQSLKHHCQLGDLGVHNDSDLTELKKTADEMAASFAIMYVSTMIERREKSKSDALGWLQRISVTKE